MAFFLDNNYTDVSGNAVATSSAGTLAFSTTDKIQGTHSWFPGNNGRFYTSTPYNLGNTFSIVFNFKSTTTGTVVIACNNAGSGNPGFLLYLNGANNTFWVRTYDAALAAGEAVSNTNAWTDGVWHTGIVLFDLPTSKVRFYANKINVTADSISQNDYPTTAALNFGAESDGGGALNTSTWLDKVEVFKHWLTRPQIDSIVDRKTTDFMIGFAGSGTTTAAPRKLNQIITYNYSLAPITEPDVVGPPTDTITYVFAEDFENFTTASFDDDSIMNRWQAYVTFMPQGSQSIVDVGGTHDKVWHSVIHSTSPGGTDGYSLRIPIDSNYTELWMSYDIYADPAFDGVTDGSHFSGKMMMGLTGGIPGFRDGGYSGWSFDTTKYAHGWEVHGVWGTGTDLRSYWHAQDAGYQLVSNTLQQPKGYWTHIDKRIVLNTPTFANPLNANGIIEDYENGVLVNQRTNIPFWSYSQKKAKQGYIDHVFLTWFFGGDASYVSPRDNYLRMDNIVAYHYNPSAVNYLGGAAAPAGHQIPIIRYPGHKYANDMLTNDTYTAAIDTIWSHNGGRFAPSYAPEGTFTTDVIDVPGAVSYALTFFRYYFGTNSGTLAQQSYCKVYSGTGIGKTLIATYNRSNSPSTLTVSSSEVTIEYYAGLNYAGGCAIKYVATVIHAADFYVSPTGSDANPGTFSQPFATWSKGVSMATAGQLVYVRGGVYSPSGTYYGMRKDNKDGTEGNPIKLWAYPGEKPIMDGAGLTMTTGSWCVELLNCDWWHIKGLTVRNASQKGTSYQAMGIRYNHCTNIITEQCEAYGIGGPGFATYGTSENIQYVNCDSHDNYDPLSASPGGNADGFVIGTITERAGNERHNYMSGCRAWNNSDDGADFWNNEGYVHLDSSWLFKNGYDQGNGSGAKLGQTQGTAEATPQRIVRNCLFAYNKSQGVDNSEAQITHEIVNNTIYGNLIRGFQLAQYTYPTILRNNLVYQNPTNNFTSYVVHDHNSWDASPSVTVTEADFVTVDSTGLAGPRQSNGKLPILNFLKPVSGSDLKDAGTDVGLSFNGTAPAMGYKEED